MELHAHSLSFVKSFSSVARTSFLMAGRMSASSPGTVFLINFYVMAKEEAVCRECAVNSQPRMACGHVGIPN